MVYDGFVGILPKKHVQVRIAHCKALDPAKHPFIKGFINGKKFVRTPEGNEVEVPREGYVILFGDDRAYPIHRALLLEIFEVNAQALAPDSLDLDPRLDLEKTFCQECGKDISLAESMQVHCVHCQCVFCMGCAEKHNKEIGEENKRKRSVVSAQDFNDMVYMVKNLAEITKSLSAKVAALEKSSVDKPEKEDDGGFMRKKLQE